MKYSRSLLLLVSLLGTIVHASTSLLNTKSSFNNSANTTTIAPGIYQHYKGHYYEVFGVANHTETLEKMVVYRALYESPEFGAFAVWCRPLAMFLENVMVRVDGVMGEVEKPRFRRVTETPPKWF